MPAAGQVYGMEQHQVRLILTLLHRDKQEEDYVGGKRQNLMTLVYNALYQQVDYSYRQNGQLSQMGEFSL